MRLANKATFLIEKSTKNMGAYLDLRWNQNARQAPNISNSSSKPRGFELSLKKLNKKKKTVLPFPNHNHRPKSSKRYTLHQPLIGNEFQNELRNNFLQNSNRNMFNFTDYVHPRVINTDSLNYMNPQLREAPIADLIPKREFNSPVKANNIFTIESENKQKIYTEADPIFTPPILEFKKLSSEPSSSQINSDYEREARMKILDDRIYLSQNPLTDEEIQEIIKRRYHNSMVDQDSHIIQNTKVYPNSLQHEPADYVSKAELKHLFDLLIKEKANDIQNEKVKEKDFQEEKQITYTQIGEIAKAFATKHLKYLKTKDKTSIYTHIQVKQSSENNRIIVLVHDIVMRKDYELTLPHQSQQLNENELIEYIENSISIDCKKDGEVYFYFKDHNTSCSTKRDTKEPETEQVNTNKESPCLVVAEEREKSLPEYKWDEKHDEIKPRLGDNLNPDIKNLENEELKKIKEIKEEILFIEESKEKGDNMKVNISEECEDKLKTLDEISKLEMDKLDEDISSSKSNSPKEESKITHHSYKT